MAIDFTLLLITDRKIVPEGKLLDAVERAVRAGVKAVQLREKDLMVKELMAYAYALREMTRKYDALLFINDRVDVACAVAADGVHLGHASMPVGAVRKITGGNFLVGVSTHGIAEARQAEASGADFITCGPVYETPSKMKYGKPIGGETLAAVVREVRIPVFAIGGIREQNIPEVVAAGVKGVAMISAILGADDIEGKTNEIVRLVK